MKGIRRKAYRDVSIAIAALIFLMFFSLPALAWVETNNDGKGNWTFDIRDPAGGDNDTYYLTTGWVINLNPTCNSNHSACNPTSGDYVVMEENRKVQTGEDNIGSDVVTYFSVNIDAVDRAFQKIGKGGVVYKQPVYINSIFHIYHPKSGSIDSQPYYTPQDIMIAKGWSAPGSFDQYYDIKTPVALAPVEALCIKSDGTAIQCNGQSKVARSSARTTPTRATQPSPMPPSKNGTANTASPPP